MRYMWYPHAIRAWPDLLYRVTLIFLLFNFYLEMKSQSLGCCSRLCHQVEAPVKNDPAQPQVVESFWPTCSHCITDYTYCITTSFYFFPTKRKSTAQRGMRQLLLVVAFLCSYTCQKRIYLDSFKSPQWTIKRVHACFTCETEGWCYCATACVCQYHLPADCLPLVLGPSVYADRCTGTVILLKQ